MNRGYKRRVRWHGIGATSAKMFAASVLAAWASGVVCGDVVWNTAVGSGNWSVADNWSPVGVPGAADAVTLPNSTAYSVFYNGPASSVASILLKKSDSIVGDTTLLVESGGLSSTGTVTLGQSCKLVVRNGAMINGGGKVVVGQYSTERGPALLVNEGTTSVGGILEVRYNSIITNSGLMSIAGALTLGADGGGGTLIQKSGTLRVVGAVGIATEGSSTIHSHIVVTGGTVTNENLLNIAVSRRNMSGSSFSVLGGEWTSASTGASRWCEHHSATDAPLEDIAVTVANGGRFRGAGSFTLAHLNGLANNRELSLYLTVTNGGRFECNGASFRLAKLTTTSDGVNNVAIGALKVDDAVFIVTNATRTSIFEIGDRPLAGLATCTGRVDLDNGGLIMLDSFIATQGVYSVVAINGGTLRARNARIDGAAAQAVGNGMSDALWLMENGGTNRFVKGLVVHAQGGLGVVLSGTAHGSSGYADASGASLNFESGSRFDVLQKPGFEPKRGDTWVVARADSIVGVPVVQADYSLTVRDDADAQILDLWYTPPFPPTVILVR